MILICLEQYPYTEHDAWENIWMPKYSIRPYCWYKIHVFLFLCVWKYSSTEHDARKILEEYQAYRYEEERILRQGKTMETSFSRVTYISMYWDIPVAVYGSTTIEVKSLYHMLFWTDVILLRIHHRYALYMYFERKKG